jgi:hypothetical protein
MVPENPTQAQAENLLHSLTYQELLGVRIDEDTRSAEAGAVVWCSMPPNGVDFTTHSRTFLQAIFTALSFCETNMVREWVVVGQYGLSILRTFDKFIEHPGRRCGNVNIYYVGMLGIVAVYVKPSFEYAHSFCAGTNGKAAKGTISDPLIGYGRRPDV